jgi:hypothetical protein
MSSFLLFWMVTALFVHAFLNFFLTVVSNVASKVSGTTVSITEHSLEAFVANLLAGVFSFFKKL